jgi:endonuclease YncB( thermonuclease family)
MAAMTVRIGSLVRLASRLLRASGARARIGSGGGARHYNRRRHFGAALFLATAALIGGMAAVHEAATASDLPADLRAAGLVADGTGRVIEALDGDTVRLADGSEVRMVGLQAPKLALGRPDFEDWPLADAAREAIEALTLGETVTLAFGGRRIDRHGRHLAHLFLEDGTWVQASLLDQGMARVYSFVDNRTIVTTLLSYERAARAAGRGIWGDPWYAVRTVDEIGDDLDTFQLVEGRVLSADRVNGRGYLNFGADWKTDFTLTLDRDALRLFDGEGIDFEALEGRRIRARGWVEYFNGAMIEITHPEQIEVLDE